MVNDNKGGLGRFFDWVNADQDLPTIEELEHHAHSPDSHTHSQEDNGHGEDGHDAHDAHHAHADTAHHGPQEDPHHTAHEAHGADGADVVMQKSEQPEQAQDAVDEELEYPDAVEAEDEETAHHETAHHGAAHQEAAHHGAHGEELHGDTVHTTHTEQAHAHAPAQTARPRKKKQSGGMAKFAYGIFAGLLSLAIITVLVVTVNDLPQFGNPENPAVNEVYLRYVERGTEETGAVNTVAGMILDYRAFDTLGESLMLFTATMMVVMLIRKPITSAKNEGEEGQEE